LALEDFTTYTEVDPGSDLTVAANTITATNWYPRNTDTYVYSDKGANHFGAAFTHTFDANMENTKNAGLYWSPYCLSNVLDDTYGLRTANEDGLHVQFTYNVGIRLVDTKDFSKDAYTGAEWVDENDLWFTVERTSETAVSCKIYTDSGRTNLEDTLVVAIDTGTRYRYVYGINSRNNGDTDSGDSTSRNLDLNEGGGGPGGTPAHYFARRRAG